MDPTGQSGINDEFLAVPKENIPGFCTNATIRNLVIAINRNFKKSRLIPTAGLSVFQAPGEQGQGYRMGNPLRDATSVSFVPITGTGASGEAPGGTGTTLDTSEPPPGTPNYEVATQENDPLTDPDSVALNTVDQTTETVVSTDTTTTIPTNQGVGNGEPGSNDACVLVSALATMLRYNGTPYGNGWKFDGPGSYPHSGDCRYTRTKHDVYQITTAVVIEGSAPTAEAGGGVIHLNVPGSGIYKGSVEHVKTESTQDIPPKKKNTYTLRRWMGSYY
jgi:hypothetical protein